MDVAWARAMRAPLRLLDDDSDDDAALARAASTRGAMQAPSVSEPFASLISKQRQHHALWEPLDDAAAADDAFSAASGSAMQQQQQPHQVRWEDLGNNHHQERQQRQQPQQQLLKHGNQRDWPLQLAQQRQQRNSALAPTDGGAAELEAGALSASLASTETTRGGGEEGAKTRLLGIAATGSAALANANSGHQPVSVAWRRQQQRWQQQQLQEKLDSSFADAHTESPQHCAHATQGSQPVAPATPAQPVRAAAHGTSVLVAAASASGAEPSDEEADEPTERHGLLGGRHAAAPASMALAPPPMLHLSSALLRSNRNVSGGEEDRLARKVAALQAQQAAQLQHIQELAQEMAHDTARGERSEFQMLQQAQARQLRVLQLEQAQQTQGLLVAQQQQQLVLLQRQTKLRTELARRRDCCVLQ